jgi:predicted dehydrogenase
MGETVRFGILGLGMGANRARLVPKTEGAELVCICDLQEERAKQTARELDCDWTTSYDDMLKRDDIDVVGVFTSSGTHCDYAIKAMKAGKHVFVTKPMDIRVEKCDEAVETAREQGVILAVDFENRYRAVNHRIKKAIDQGRLGKILIGDLRVKWYRSQEYYSGGYPPGWRSRRAAEGGVCANQAVHFIDLVNWFIGPVVSVYARSGTFAHNIETEDLTIALWSYKSGALGSFVATTANHPSLGTTIEITGDNGTIVWKDGEVLLYRLKDDPQASLNKFEQDLNLPSNIIEDMVSAIRNSTPVMCNGVEGRKSVVIFNAMYESSRLGKVVDINL